MIRSSLTQEYNDQTLPRSEAFSFVITHCCSVSPPTDIIKVQSLTHHREKPNCCHREQALGDSGEEKPKTEPDCHSRPAAAVMTEI